MGRAEFAEVTFLSLDRARRIAPAEFLPAYDWFLAHEDTMPMRRPTSTSGLSEGLPVGLVAGGRGIHKPAHFDYALSITVTGNDLYNDRAIDQNDGTWILYYRAQEKNIGSKTTTDIYNKALKRCMVDGIPVGVLIKTPHASTSLYDCKGLAFVESYEDGVFTLHGPVREGQEIDFWSIATGDDISQEGRDTLREIDDRDERIIKNVQQVIRHRQNVFRQNLLRAYGKRCAVTGCDVVPALQAAHICSYRGPKSQFTSNGLLLRADLHLLYDSYMLSVDPDDYRVVLSPLIAKSSYAEIDRKRIRIPNDPDDRPSLQRLEAHFSRFRIEQTV